MNSRWNTTEAYDLSLYEVQQPVPERSSRTVPPQKPKKMTRKAAEKALARRLLACAVLTVAFLSMVLYHNVAIVEIGDEIRSEADLLADLKNEYSYLTGRLTTRTAIEVDQYAAAQGLCKVQSYQVNYIRLDTAEQAVRTAEAPTGSFLESLIDRMDTVLEYLRIK